MTVTRLHPLFAPVLALLLAGCAAAQPGGTGETNPNDAAPLLFGERVGVTVHFDREKTNDHLDELVDLGVKWVRDNEQWKVVEQKPGEYVWPENFVNRLKFYKEHDIAVCYGLWYGNPVAYPEAPFDPEHYADYALAMARMLDEAGVEYILELWNEPHNFALKKSFGGAGNAEPPSPWAERYVALVNAAVEKVKAEFPDVTMISNEDQIAAHYWFLELGFNDKLDGFALHPYVHGPSPGPEMTSYGPDVDWAQPWTVIDEDQSFGSMIRRVKQQYREKLGHEPQVWITEWGYRLGKRMSREDEDLRVDEDTAADFLPRLYVLSVAHGARAVMWHNLQDFGDGPFGLIRNNEEKRKTYAAFKTMTAQLGDYELVEQIAGAETPASGVQAYRFEKRGGVKVVAWTVDGDAAVRIDTGSSAPLRIEGVVGQRVGFEYEEDGLPRVTLTRSPVYISGVLDDVRVTPVAADAGN